MGQLWRAKDVVLDRPVAVKVLSGALTKDPEFLTRFRYEARHAALVGDPGIAAVHDYGEATGSDGERIAYLVMELVEGETLSALIQRRGGLDLPQTLDVVRQTASALAAAHAAGVVHRDVKPANVLVRPDGVVKLADFGIAWSAANVPLTRTARMMGSVHYVAPERVEGARATPASDVYSLGVIAHECLTGRRPFDGDNSAATALRHLNETPPALPAHLPRDVRGLVERAMSRDPADRFPDGAALRDAVQAVQAAGPPLHPTLVLPADAAPADEPAPGRRRPRPALVAAVGAVLLVLLVVAGALVLFPSAPRSAATAPPAPSSASASAAASSSTAAPFVRRTVTLASDGLVGRSVDDVRAQLEAAGFVVRVEEAAASGVPAGQVVGVDPVGAGDPGGALSPGQLGRSPSAAAPPAPATTAAPPSTAAQTSGGSATSGGS